MTGALRTVAFYVTWAAFLCLSLGQGAASAQETVSDLEVSLDWPAVAVYPAGESSFLTLSQNGTLELRQLTDGKMRGGLQLAGTPVAVSHALSDRGIREFAFILQSFRSVQDASGYRLQFVSTDGKRMALGRLDQSRSLQNAEFVTLVDFTNPGVVHGLSSPKSEASEFPPVVIWDRTDDPDTFAYKVFTDSGLIDLKTPLYPTALAPIGSERELLAIHGYAGEASFFDIWFGEPNGNVFDETLTTQGPAQPPAGTGLVTYAPRAAEGGTGRVAIANLTAGAMTILESLPSSRVSRLARPVTAPLPAVSTTLIDPTDVRLMGDENLTRIYLTIAGSDGPATVWGFEALKGGLEALEPIQLPYPIRDMKRFQFKRAAGGGLYAILSGDGRTVRFVDDIARAFSTETTVDPLATRITTLAVKASQDSAGADVLTVQRILASLGYNVGTLDGISGPVTQNAVRAFQLDNALEATGLVNEKTAALLQERVQSATLGLWHALIASHTPDARGCAFAVDDVREFAQLLEGRVEPGTEIYIVETTSPTVYAVAISTGDDREMAREVSSQIRQVSPKSADGRTGVDSFVTTNKGWREVDNCRARAKVP